MAFENLFVRKKRDLAGVPVDGVLSEDHTWSNRVSENPSELGVNINDNKKRNPNKLVMEVVVSNTKTRTAAITGIFSTSDLTPLEQFSNDLYELLISDDPLEIQTGMKLYENLVVENIRMRQDVNSANAIVAIVSLTERIVVRSSVIDIDPEDLEEGFIREQSQSLNDKGVVNPRTLSTEKESTYLKKAYDFLVGE